MNAPSPAVPSRTPLISDATDESQYPRPPGSDATRLYVAGKYFGESVRESANVSTLNANHAPP